MLISFSEIKDFKIVRSDQCVCKHCGNDAVIALLKEQRTVRFMILLTQTSQSYHLACSNCKALFSLGSKFKDNEDAEIRDLMLLAGGKEFPFMLGFLLISATLFILMPIINIVLIFQIKSYKIYMGPIVQSWYKLLIYGTWLVNVALIVFIMYAVMK